MRGRRGEETREERMTPDLKSAHWFRAWTVIIIAGCESRVGIRVRGSYSCYSGSLGFRFQGIWGAEGLGLWGRGFELQASVLGLPAQNVFRLPVYEKDTPAIQGWTVRICCAADHG